MKIYMLDTRATDCIIPHGVCRHSIGSTNNSSQQQQQQQQYASIHSRHPACGKSSYQKA